MTSNPKRNSDNKRYKYKWEKRGEDERIASLVWKKYGEDKDQHRTDSLGKALWVKWDLSESVTNALVPSAPLCHNVSGSLRAGIILHAVDSRHGY